MNAMNHQPVVIKDADGGDIIIRSVCAMCGTSVASKYDANGWWPSNIEEIVMQGITLSWEQQPPCIGYPEGELASEWRAKAMAQD